MSIVYAFVFARGGSKGLPRKNTLRLGSIPLIGHSIQQAKLSNKVSKVFVSTEDSEIISIAKEYGAEIIDRPSELASDEAPEVDAWRHAVSYLEEKGENFDVFISLPATSPLRNSNDIENCLSALDDNTDSVITVTPASRNPFFNMVVMNSDASCELMTPSRGYSRRQDAPQAYDITTVAYVLHKKFILAGKNLFDGRVKAVIVPKERAVDIDDIYDFKLAELLYMAQFEDKDEL